MKKAIQKIMIGAVILQVAIVCIFILIGNFDDTAWHAILSTTVIFGLTIPCLLYSRIYDNEKYKYIAIIGASLAGISALMYIINIWDLINENEIYNNITGSLIDIVIVLSLISWVLSHNIANKTYILFKKISIILASILGLYAIIRIWVELPDGFLTRLYWVLLVLTAGSYICSLILTRIYEKDEVIPSKQNVIASTQEQNSVQSTPVQQNNDENKQI